MINGLRSEFYKLFHARIFWVLLLLFAGISLLTAGLIFLEEKGILVESITVEVNEDMVTGPLHGWNALLDSLIAPDSFFTYLFAVLLGAFFLAGEYSNGTIKNIVSTGYKRHVFYITKMIVIWVGTIIISSFMTVVFAVLTSLLMGLGPMPSNVEWLEALKSLGLTWLLFGGFSAIATFISVNASSTATALFAGLGFYLFFVTGIDMLASKYIVFENVTQYSIFDYMRNIPFNLSSSSKFIQSLIGVSLGTIVIFTSGGIALFHRRDIG